MRNLIYWIIVIFISCGLISRCNSGYKQGWRKAEIEYFVEGCKIGLNKKNTNKQYSKIRLNRFCRCSVNKLARTMTLEESLVFSYTSFPNEISAYISDSNKKLLRSIDECKL